MNTQIDWLSFSLFYEGEQPENDRDCIYAAWDRLDSFLGDERYFIVGEGDMQPSGGRKPYSISMRSADNGVAVYLNPKLTHFLVEFSGVGCERFRNNDHARRFLKLVSERVTRIDIACDVACETNPIRFANQRRPGRFKSHSEVVSESGTTAYVGSRSSDRYARVYRYNEPHPRAALLRIEHVFRNDHAKLTLAYWLEHGALEVARQCGGTYGWYHEDWQLKPPTTKELTPMRTGRDEKKTIFWLYNTVAPLIGRLHASGDLDLSDFLHKALNTGTLELEVD